MTTGFSGNGPVSATVLYQERITAVPRAVEKGGDLWLTLPALKESSGWELKPEGVCQEDFCVPLPEADRNRYLVEEGGTSWFNLSAFAGLVEQPVAHDAAHHTWYFGPPGWDWKGHADARMAPDFTLADLEGRHYSLSSYRGKKVVLALWASW